MATQPAEGNVLLDVAGAADYLGVSEVFVRRLVLERRVRYYKVGKLVRFRPVDLDAFVEAGRRDPVEPWVPARSPLGRLLSAYQGAGSEHAREAPECNHPAPGAPPDADTKSDASCSSPTLVLVLALRAKPFAAPLRGSP